MIRFSRVSTLVALVASAPSWASSASAEPVRLEVANRTADRTIECQVLLAHFFSIPLDALEPGDERTTSFERDPRSGDLMLRNDAGTVMMVENVLCGATGQWARGRAEIPLAVLRAGQSARFACTGDADAPVTCDAVDDR